jgi:hypothetical protein
LAYEIPFGCQDVTRNLSGRWEIRNIRGSELNSDERNAAYGSDPTLLNQLFPSAETKPAGKSSIGSDISAWTSRLLFGTDNGVELTAHVYAGGIPNIPRPHGLLDYANFGAGAIHGSLRAVDDGIMAPPADQSGAFAYANGVAVGIYEFGGAGVQGFLTLLSTHPKETSTALVNNLKETLAAIREGLTDQDLDALKKVDYELWQLVNLQSYNSLTEWNKGRLTAKLTLKYALLVDTGVEATGLLTDLVKGSKAFAGKVLLGIRNITNCFAAGTLLLTPTGSKAIEEFRWV